MTTVVLVFGVPIAVIVLAVYLMRHRNNRVTRAIADASAKYNELYGQGLPPRLPLPPDPDDDPDDGADDGAVDWPFDDPGFGLSDRGRWPEG